MRQSQTALKVIEDNEPARVELEARPAPDEEPPSRWERAATVATILVGTQFALLALLGL